MPNQNGIVETFTYQETPGVNRTAWLDETKGKDFGIKDAEWRVKNPDKSTDDGPYRHLTYLGTDGDIWRTETECTRPAFGAGKITVTFKSTGNRGGRNDSNWIEIVDWDGSHWKVTVQDVQVEGQPKFHLQKK